MRTPREPRPTAGPDPFAPIETVVNAMLALFVLGLGAVLLLVGVFTDDSARATRRLGWFLIVLGVALPLGARIGVGVVVAAAIPGQSWWSQVTYGIPLSAPLLITGLGVLSFARILRVAVPLQEEAALTV